MIVAMFRKPAGSLLLGTTVVAIAAATLTPGAGGSPSGFCILCGTRGAADFLSNIALFVPFAAALAASGRSVRTAVLAALLFSLGIEVAQIGVVPGRDANAGDLLANTLGGLLGSVLFHHRRWWLAARGAAARSLATTAATLAVVMFGLYLLEPSPPARPYFLQWTARFGHMRAYDGRVMSTRIGDVDLAGPWLIEDSDTVRHLLERGAPIVFQARAGAPSNGTAPIVSIYDDLRREVLLVGADAGDLILRYRPRAADWLLDHGEIRVRGAFDAVTAGSNLRVAIRRERNGYCIEANRFARCAQGFTAGDTFTLLMAPRWQYPARTIAGCIWLFILFIPGGLIGGTKRLAIASMAAIATVLVIAPVVFGYPPTPVLQVMAACAGNAAGAWMRNSTWRRWIRDDPADDHRGSRRRGSNGSESTTPNRLTVS